MKIRLQNSYPKLILCLSVVLAQFGLEGMAHAIGDAATRFNIYVPGNNAYTSRRVFLIVTSVSTEENVVNIIDDDADGDDDDTVTGAVLTRGQSYLVRIADGAVNDDLGGKNDGDYFRIESEHPVVVQMATQSNWQHDWAPSEGKGSRGVSFFIYAPPTSGADNDLNIYAYEDFTDVTVLDITTGSTPNSGPTQIDLGAGVPVLSRTLHTGEDLIVRENGLGLDVLDPGRTYWVRASRPVTVQYGHLGQVQGGNQARDGAGFVPGVDGSATSSLYYFMIPHNPGLAREKELRVVCFDDGATVELFGTTADATGWELIDSATVDSGEHLDYVGRTNAAFRNAELYRLVVDPPYYRCTVFEGNWMETGSFGTSDFASAVSSRGGSNVGYQFTAYMGPPGKQENVRHPLGEQTNNASPSAGYASHLYIYAYEDDTGVTVQDTDSSGAVFGHSFALQKDEYYDVVVDRDTYLALSSNGIRPYVQVDSAKPIMVMNGNFNDNWMAYFHSVIRPEPKTEVSASKETVSCNEYVEISVACENRNGPTIENGQAHIRLPEGVQVVETDGAVSSDGREVSWDLGQMVSSSSASGALSAQIVCAEGCQTDSFLTLTAECRGVSSGAPYASVQSTNLRFSAPNEIEMGTFFAKDLPDYEAATPNSRVEVTIGLSGGVSGATELSLYRATNNPDPDANQVLLWSGAATGDGMLVEYADAYSQHLESTRFYRVRAETNGCVKEFGPVALQTSSGSSGGEDSGLESNGRLSSQLAQRAIVRGVARRTSTEGRGLARLPLTGELVDRALMALLPDSGPFESTPENVTPSDLLSLTNATGVASVDYRTASQERIATVLMVKTEGAVYEHSKIECDRAKGAELATVEEMVEPEGSLIRFALTTGRERSGDYAIELKLYEEDDGAYTLHNHWLRGQYPKPKTEQSVINLQIWSKRPGAELSLLSQILERAQVRFSESGETPRAWFKNASMLGQTTKAFVERGEKKNADSGSLFVRVTTLEEDGSMGLEDYSLFGAEFLLDSTPLVDATLELVDEDGRVLDTMWLADGAWAAYHDQLFGGRSIVDRFETLGCKHRSAVDGLPLSGCGRISGEVSDFLGVARHIGGAEAPLSIDAFASMQFWAASSQSIEVCLDGNGEGAERACAWVPGDADGRHYELNLEDFRTIECGARPTTPIDLISFSLRGVGHAELSVEDLSFSALKSDATAVVAHCLDETKTSETEEVRTLTAPQSGCACRDGAGSNLDPLWLIAGLGFFVLRRRRDRQR